MGLNLTEPNPELGALRRATRPRMAHWAGTGPQGKTCGGCANHGQVSARDGDTLYSNRCKLFQRRMNGRVGGSVPAKTASCPFLRTDEGKSYSRNLLSTHWNREREDNEALGPLKEAGLVLHGLRATAVVRARKRGLTDLQISNVFGMSEAMVARYSRLADQGEMAMAAVHFLNRTAGEQDFVKIRALQEKGK